MDPEVFFSLLLLIPFFYLYFKRIFSKNPPLPPGPFAWPIVGNFFQMGRQLHYILANLARIHGPLMSLRFGKQITIIASSPDAAREVLKTHDRDLSGRYIANAVPLINPKLNFAFGASPECNDYWRGLRVICKSDLFSAKVLESQNHIREKKVSELVVFLGSKEGEVVNLGETVYVTFSNILSNAIFSVDFFDFVDKGIGKDLRKLIVEIVELRMIPDLSDFYPILTRLDFQELMRNQDVLHKLRDELKREIGKEMVKESHLAHLPYLEACVKETLRLYPPGPLLLPRRALQTCQVMGYTIPKDSKILVNMWAIGRDPSIFNDPLRFKPERFLDSSLDFKGTNFAYTPFGAGRRVCPGQPLATKQVPLILASLVHSFDWFLSGGMKSTELDMNDHFAITLKKKQPLQLIPKGRK
uniref:Cytochrome P450 n=1 Tax=Quercus lobata TaxID=97700 RepID=A0A7N2MI65_QUELO